MGIEGFIGLAIMVGLYVLPTIIAVKKEKQQQSAIIVLNIFFGWTGICWLIALIWSLLEEK